MCVVSQHNGKVGTVLQRAAAAPPPPPPSAGQGQGKQPSSAAAARAAVPRFVIRLAEVRERSAEGGGGARACRQRPAEQCVRA
eukprot:COSAG01_NODE_1095_length_11714_cov_9.062930_13_plen_83_part_00